MKAIKSRYKVLKKEQLSAQTFLLYTERPEVSVKAGQCFSVGTKELGINREYSIYSGVNESFLTFLIREVEDGIVSPVLGACETDYEVEIHGPYGEFCLLDDHIEQSPFIFIASGTGIAPFHSFIKTYPNLNYKLFHGVRGEEETYERDHYLPDCYIPCISRPTQKVLPQRVTDYFRCNAICTQTIYYLCGNRKMITDTIPLLLNAGVSGDHIFTETFF